LKPRKQSATYRRLLAAVDPPRKCDLPADKWTLSGEARRQAIAAFLEWFAQRPALSALGKATDGYPIEDFAADCRRRVAAKRTENTGYYRNTKAGSRGQVRNRRGKFT
jgi:hypothetical protein